MDRLIFKILSECVHQMIIMIRTSLKRLKDTPGLMQMGLKINQISVNKFICSSESL